MKQILSLFAGLALVITSCQFSSEPSMQDVIQTGLERATQQSIGMAESLKNQEGLLPRTLDKDGKLTTSDSRWWCSGFFPGVLWYLYEASLYEASENEQLKDYAKLYTARIEREKYTTNNHDVGFMLYCSFGNGIRLVPDSVERYKEILLTGSKSLSTRFRDSIGVIQSWGTSKKWQCPVIIDNMMNLELLMWASKMSEDLRFAEIAKSHADVTIKEHYRPDYSCYHVVSYDTLTFQPEKKQTAQGYADESAWARGQAWGLYGYTMMYRETGYSRYFDQAKQIAAYLINHPKMPTDKVPYWDFDAPNVPNEPRDASSAALMASALIELSQMETGTLGKHYLEYAQDQLRSLTTPEYLAEPGTNGNFVLKHSTGSIPHNSEIDVPLTYADYYYVEALLRLKKLLN